MISGKKLPNFIYFHDSGWKPAEGGIGFINRSFLFGDGFFETIRLGKSGFCPLLPFHLNRIEKSAEALKMKLPADFSVFIFDQLMQREDFPDSVSDVKLRLVFFRPGDGSYVPQADMFPGILAMLENLSFPVIYPISKLAVSETVNISPTAWGWMKSTSALPYVLASMERSEKQCDELLLCSPEGYVVEGTYSAIFWQIKGLLYFTSARLGGIESCMRKFVQQHLHKNSLLYSEIEIRPEVLLSEADWICCLSGLAIRVWFPSNAQKEIPEPLRSLPLQGFIQSPF